MNGDFNDLRVDVPDPFVMRITLARPTTRNAYTTRSCDELVRALEIFLRDDALRVLILTGEGRAFCAGGDVSGADPMHAELMQTQLSHGREMRDGMHRVMRALWQLDKPVIAMLNGPAVAGGLALALACDLRIAAESARLGDTSGRLGLLPDEGGAWLFPRAMGSDRALKMSWLGEVYDATTALALGLVTEVVPDADLDAHTRTLARAIAGRAPLAVRLTKAMMKRGLGATFDQALAEAALAVMVSNTSEDAREGVLAFREKREPHFKGR